MSFLTTSQPQQHNLVLNYFKNYRETIVTMRCKNYHKRLENRHIATGTKQREIEWFQELDKGCLVYVEGKREPMRGLMYWDDFIAGLIWKKAIAMFLKFLGGHENFTKKKWWEKLVILVSALKMYQYYVNFLHFALYDNIYENTEKYSQPTREIYRVFPKEWPLERDLGCFFVESDHAYRYRAQDIIVEVNKEAFKKNPAKEIQRLIDIMISREISEGTMRDKWRIARKITPFVFLYLSIFKLSVLKKIVKMVEDIDLNEIRMSKEDLYWTNEADSYNFRGISYATRKILNT